MSSTQTLHRPSLPDGLLGVGEIAALCHVSVAAVNNWMKRAPRDTPFPQPIERFIMGPLYWWPEVAQWLTATGREQYTNPNGVKRLNRFDAPEEPFKLPSKPRHTPTIAEATPWDQQDIPE